MEPEWYGVLHLISAILQAFSGIMSTIQHKHFRNMDILDSTQKDQSEKQRNVTLILQNLLYFFIETILNGVFVSYYDKWDIKYCRYSRILIILYTPSNQQ